MSEFVYTKFSKAKKEHRCDTCNKIILVGDRYANVAGKGDFSNYRISTMKMCSDCNPKINHSE